MELEGFSNSFLKSASKEPPANYIAQPLFVWLSQLCICFQASTNQERKMFKIKGDSMSKIQSEWSCSSICQFLRKWCLNNGSTLYGRSVSFTKMILKSARLNFHFPLRHFIPLDLSPFLMPLYDHIIFLLSARSLHSDTFPHVICFYQWRKVVG